MNSGDYSAIQEELERMASLLRLEKHSGYVVGYVEKLIVNLETSKIRIDSILQCLEAVNG